MDVNGETASSDDVLERRRTPWCDVGRGNCIPPRGAKPGDAIDAREGDDSAWRRDWRPRGVGGTKSGTLVVNDLSRPGVRIVRFAGRRRLLFGGI